MKVERSDIKFPMWRKKVDMVLLEKLHTPIPNWLSEVWKVKETFGVFTSKKRPGAEVTVKLEGKTYCAWVTYAKYQDKDPAYRLWISKELSAKLKDLFVMSYMRSLELRLRKAKNKTIKNIEDRKKTNNIEDEIRFWEFLDIEFNHTKKEFVCNAHYFHKPIFPELFKAFLHSHILHRIESTLADKENFRFIKEDWKPRSELKTQLDRHNIIYYLIDTANKLLYIGEGGGSDRITKERSEIPDWDYYRIDNLPSSFSKTQRVQIERLMIRSFAAILTNQKIESKSIANYTLLNIKIDKV